jgi:hypothetical protein
VRSAHAREQSSLRSRTNIIDTRIPIRAFKYSAHAFVATVAFLALTGVGQADILSTAGAIVVIAPPPDARTGQFENDHAIHLFPEQLNVILPATVSVNVTKSGSTTTGGILTLSPGAIPAGTLVSSYFLHFDDVGTSQNPISAQGSVTFTTDVLGIAILAPALNATDAMPGLPTTIYASGDGLRGFEPPTNPGAADVLTLSADHRTVTLFLQNVDKSDDVRIITAGVPEPSTLVLLAFVLAWPLLRSLRQS